MCTSVAGAFVDHLKVRGGTDGDFFSEWEWWERVPLDELLSKPNTVLTQEGFFQSLDNQSDSLSMFGCDQSSKLCKDIGK